MAAREVEAVWVWRYLVSPFKAVYGRLPGNAYTKDYLQVAQQCAAVMDEVFHRPTDGTVDITYCWPGGSVEGELLHSVDRLHLSWPTGSPPDAKSPLPWRLTPTPDAIQAIPGNPNKTTEATADQELERLRALNVEPWLVAVKLFDEPNRLHVRAYMGRPPAGFEYASVNRLPDVVRAKMAQVPGNSACGVVKCERGGDLRADAIVGRILAALERSPNVLLVGPPGTGKTVALEDLRALFETDATTLAFDPELGHDAWRALIPPGEHKVVSVVFHPSYSYEEFVVGLLPKGGVGFELQPRPGPFLSLAHWAMEPNRHGLLIADEFNRGNAAAIFGDMLALLDKDKREPLDGSQTGASVSRAYPTMNVEVAPDYENSTGALVPPLVRLPAGLYLVAALNSSDRSVAPLDAALRRRFSVIRVAPDYEVLASHLGVSLPPVGFRPPGGPANWAGDDVRRLAVELLRELNGRIESVLGEDFLLGHSMVWDVAGETREALVKALAAAFDEQIAGSLRMTFADQDEQLGAILRAGQPPANTAAAGTASGVASWALPEPEVAPVAVARLRIRQLCDLPWEEAAELLASLL